MSFNEIKQIVSEKLPPGSNVKKAAEASEIEQLVRVAFQLADAAEALTLKYFRLPLSVDNKLDMVGADEQTKFDPVTVADREAEAAMRAILKDVCPHDGIIGEELGVTLGRSERQWILDPIDGTRAYITGIPLWGTLIGLQSEQKPILGLVDQPFLGERYYGHMAGAFRQYRERAVEALAVRTCVQLSDAVMLTTTPDMFSGLEVPAFEELRKLVMLSRFGGDCYAYCMLASGFVDLVVESDLQAYDIQPIVPIIEGAGGIVTNWKGEPVTDGGQVLAAGDPRVHAAAMSVLRSGASTSI